MAGVHDPVVRLLFGVREAALVRPFGDGPVAVLAARKPFHVADEAFEQGRAPGDVAVHHGLAEPRLFELCVAFLGEAARGVELLLEFADVEALVGEGFLRVVAAGGVSAFRLLVVSRGTAFGIAVVVRITSLAVARFPRRRGGRCFEQFLILGLKLLHGVELPGVAFGGGGCGGGVRPGFGDGDFNGEVFGCVFHVWCFPCGVEG